MINARGDGADPDEVDCGPGEDGDDQGEDEDDGCEHVKRPGGPKACDSHERSCDDPVETEPEPDEPVEEPEAGSEKLL